MNSVKTAQREELKWPWRRIGFTTHILLRCTHRNAPRALMTSGSAPTTHRRHCHTPEKLFLIDFLPSHRSSKKMNGLVTNSQLYCPHIFFLGIVKADGKLSGRNGVKHSEIYRFDAYTAAHACRKHIRYSCTHHVSCSHLMCCVIKIEHSER